MSVTYTIEDALQDQEEIERMAKQCWDEVDQMNGALEFKLDWDTYKQLNDAGQLRYYTVKNDVGRKVGFAAFIIIPTLHCQGNFTAVSDVVYLEKDYRGHGLEFLKLIQEDLKTEGVSWFTLHVKSWLDHVGGKLSEVLGCKLYEHVYQRRL